VDVRACGRRARAGASESEPDLAGDRAYDPTHDRGDGDDDRGRDDDDRDDRGRGRVRRAWPFCSVLGDYFGVAADCAEAATA